MNRLSDVDLDGAMSSGLGGADWGPLNGSLQGNALLREMFEPLMKPLGLSSGPRPAVTSEVVSQR